MIRGIRGAITVESNTKEMILKATEKLLLAMDQQNDIPKDDIASVILTTTPDLNEGFPAEAARNMGWTKIPLLCAQEIDVPGSLLKVVRVLMHVNTDKAQDEIKHVYLDGATALRDDI